MPDSADLLQSLLPFADTAPKQRTAISLMIEHGDADDVARRMNTTRGMVLQHIRRAKARAARRGWDPDHDTPIVPEGYHVRGTSTLYGGDGQVVARWVKTQADKDEAIDAVIGACERAFDAYQRPGPIDPAPTYTDADMMSVYAMGDPHVGMYAWAEEAGEDFDLEIARNTYLAAVDQAVAVSRPTARALIVQAGDFYHADNASNRTAASGHALDVDTRWANVLDTGIAIMVRIIERALERHDEVDVINAIGNHDDHTAVVLSSALRAWFRNESRVTIEKSPRMVHYREFGRCLLGVTHGHTIKAPKLPGVMAADQPEAWGRTRHRHWYTGHVHHESHKDYAGCSVETLRTLAAKDAWHAGQGYRSERDMKLDTWHKDWGRIERHRIGIAQLRGRR